MNSLICCVEAVKLFLNCAYSQIMLTQAVKPLLLANSFFSCEIESIGDTTVHFPHCEVFVRLAAIMTTWTGAWKILKVNRIVHVSTE